mmetsp:Transcript_71497/g.154260  ORF Transcript_71497/g.154260 Transcript_71497/m.154260 type:complete len:402 (-) Transcript_71497:21-1226(-)
MQPIARIEPISAGEYPCQAWVRPSVHVHIADQLGLIVEVALPAVDEAVEAREHEESTEEVADGRGDQALEDEVSPGDLRAGEDGAGHEEEVREAVLVLADHVRGDAEPDAHELRGHIIRGLGTPNRKADKPTTQDATDHDLRERVLDLVLRNEHRRRHRRQERQVRQVGNGDQADGVAQVGVAEVREHLRDLIPLQLPIGALAHEGRGHHADVGREALSARNRREEDTQREADGAEEEALQTRSQTKGAASDRAAEHTTEADVEAGHDARQDHLARGSRHADIAASDHGPVRVLRRLRGTAAHARGGTRRHAHGSREGRDLAGARRRAGGCGSRATARGSGRGRLAEGHGLRRHLHRRGGEAGRVTREAEQRGGRGRLGRLGRHGLEGEEAGVSKSCVPVA